MIIKHKLDEKASYASPFLRQVDLTCNTRFLVGSGNPNPQTSIQTWQTDDSEDLSC